MDDDVRLERHAIEELVEAAARYQAPPWVSWGTLGDEFIHAETFGQERLPSCAASILGGYRGVLYPLRVLDLSLADDYAEVSRRCAPFLADDELTCVEPRETGNRSASHRNAALCAVFHAEFPVAEPAGADLAR